MPEPLETGRNLEEHKQLHASRTSQPADAASVSYAPLNKEDVPKGGVEAKPAAEKVKDSGKALLDPAKRAAERARVFRLSQQQAAEKAGVETAAAKDASSAGQGVEKEKMPAEADKTAKDMEDTLSSNLPGGSSVAPEGKLQFEKCVHLALKQSPYFVKSAMQVQLRRIDETDSWYQLLPKFLMSTGYVISGPDVGSDDRFSLSFSTGSYDPIAAGFTIKATKLVTKIAILAHMSSINEGLYNLGTMFITLGHLKRLLVLQDEIVALAKHEKTYLSNLLETGGTNSLEVRIAEQQLEMAVLERENLEARYNEVLGDMKIFLGLGEADQLKLDLKDAGEQVVGYFRPEDIPAEEVKANNLELKIHKQESEIQEYNVKLAWAEYMPKFYFQTRTPDPIDKEDADDGLYFSAGFTWTLWDWGERYRNVRRQRLGVRQDVVKQNMMELDITSDWRSMLATKRRTRAALKTARAKVELAGLLKRQGEISYQAGTNPFPVYLDLIRDYFSARKRALESEYEDNKAMFDLRFMSGDLFNSFINANEI